MIRKLSNMSRSLRQISWFTLSVLMIGFPLFSQAAEAPGGITVLVKDQLSERPLSTAQITITERETNSTQSAETDAQGRIVVEQLDPGLYSVNVARSGYASSFEPSVRVITRKNIQIEFELVREQAITEVVVQSRQADRFSSASSTYLNREALRSAVGGGADPLLSLDGLPGLASTGEFASFSVRGRGPRDNLLFVDDFPFDKVIHFDATLGEDEDIGGGGRFSVFAPNVVSGAEFSPGGWGPAYGGRAASLLKLEVADGNPSPSAHLRLDLAGFEVGYDGPGITEASTMLVNARQLDFGSLFETIEELDIGEPVLRDIIVKSVIPINQDHTFELLLMDTHEDYTRGVTHVNESPNFEDAALLDFEQDSDLYGLTLRSLIGNEAVWTNKVYYRTSDKISSEGEAFPDLVPEGSPASSFPVREDIITIGEEETEIGWRSDFETVNRWGVFSAGIRAAQIELDYDTVLDGDWTRFVYDVDDFRASPDQRFILQTPANTNSSLNQKETNYAAYIDQVFEHGDWDIRTGVRFDRDGFADESFASPRFSVNWRPDSKMRYFATAGLFHQSPRYLDLAANASNTLETEEITHSSVGFQYFLNNDWSLLTEVYYQNLDKLVVDLDQVSGTFANIGDGTSTGVDIVVNGTIREGLYTTTTYSYNDAVVDRKDGRGDVAADFSREHVATLGLTWEISDRWKVAGRYKFLSGRPSDRFIIHSDVLGAGQPLRYSKEITERNVGRNSSYSLMNVRADYRRAFGPIDVTAFLDIINVTAASSSDDSNFDYRRGVEVEDENEAEPLIGLRLDYAW